MREGSTVWLRVRKKAREKADKGKGLFTDGTVLLARRKRMVPRIIDEVDRVCERRTLKAIPGKK